MEKELSFLSTPQAVVIDAGAGNLGNLARPASEIPEKRYKSRLLKVIVVSQSFRDSSLLHEKNRRAIGQAPGFVRPPLVKRQRGSKKLCALRHDIELYTLLETAHRLYGSVPKRRSQTSAIIEELDEDHLAGDQRTARKLSAHFDRSAMQAIPRVEQSNPVTGIGEHRLHIGFLAVS